jgi:NRE family putative nickel resistance protein-like MFS transporter
MGAGSSAAALFLARRAERLARGARRPAAAHLRLHCWAARALVAGGAVLSLALLPGVLRPDLGALLVLWALNGAGQSLIAVPTLALLAEHADREERGRAYAAHFALTHAFWLLTYPAAGHLARAVGTPLTFTLAGGVCGFAALSAIRIRAPHRPHAIEAA